MQIGDTVKRVVIEQYQVGVFADLYRTHSRLPSKKLRGIQRGHLQNLQGR